MVTVKDLFAQLIEAREEGGPDDLTTAERALEAAPPEVRSAVLELVKARERADGLLSEDGSRKPPSMIEPQPVLEDPREIGPYRLHEVLGRGGFGIVYRATQSSPVERTVAIKILRAELSTPEVVRRFKGEAKLLARMDHPGIARVLDAGVFEQSAGPLGTVTMPYLVMELVDGERITDYCESHGLSLKERVRLMVQVANTVHHAHQRAIIHRDIKPSNIIVSTVSTATGTEARPRVIDFGIAKLLEEDQDHNHTRAGARLGTPRYMSPEQALAGDSADVRSDVYAMGVVLCELLTSSIPYEDPDRAEDDPTTTISNRTPTRPSSLASAAGSPEVAARAKLIRGDLDRIVLMAVATEPDRRYVSAAAFGQDLERYLNGEPVRAVPPTTIYYTRKFIARHSLGVALGLLAVLALFAMLGLAIDGRHRAITQREIAIAARVEAARQAERAEFVSAFLLEDMLDAADPESEAGSRITVAAMLDRAAESAGTRFADDPETLADVMGRIGIAYDRLGLFEQAADALEVAIANIDREENPLRALNLEMERAVTIRYLPKTHQEGADLITDLISRATAQLGEDHHLVVRLRLEELANHDVGMDYYIQVVGEIRERVDPEALPRYTRLLLLKREAIVQSYLGDTAGAIETWIEVVALAKQLYSETHSTVFECAFALAEEYLRAKEYARAGEVLLEYYPGVEAKYGPYHGILTGYRSLMTRAFFNQRDFERAYEFASIHERSTREYAGDGSIPHSTALHSLGNVELMLGRYEDAYSTLKRASSLQFEQWGTKRPRAYKTTARLAQAQVRTGRYEEAVATATVTIENLDITDPFRPFAIQAKVHALIALGRGDEAEAVRASAVAEYAGVEAEAAYLKIINAAPGSAPG